MTSHHRLTGAAVLAALALSGCNSTPSCLGDQPYMEARAFPPLQAPPGLSVPEPEPAMQIPQVGNGPIGRYEELPADRDANDPAARCLTTPPTLRTQS